MADQLQQSEGERQRAEEAVRRSEEHFRSLIENSLDIITVLEEDGTIRYASPSVRRVLGFRPVELLGQSTLALIHPDDAPQAAAALAARLQYPILADPLSGLRCGPHPRDMVLDAYDASLRDPRVVERLAPAVVLRLGAMPTSKSLQVCFERHPGARQVVVDGGGGWNEPTGLASEVLHVDEGLLCAALLEVLPTRGASAWLDEWRSIDRGTRAALTEYLAGLDELFEGKVFAELASLLPDGSTLYVGNSMPVRDLDAFFHSSPRDVRFLANRGANGIDGVVSSALGASAVNSRRGPTVLAIGDLSFYHDLNGLLAARRHRLDLTVVLLNNDGGGIFSFLPQADIPEHFEALFGTPHGLDFAPFVAGYQGHFVRIATWNALRDGLSVALSSPGLHVLEVPTERRRNVQLHRAAWQATFDARRLVAAAR
jgi:2-succinyl-5-enolpyruvyl-6-hydroxy-3-cyclohexene-1-carboxylate synthase